MADKVSSISYFSTEENIVKSNRKHDEGGKEAWLTVLGSFLVYYSSFGIINSFGFFQNYYQTEYLVNASPAQISIIGTLQMALMNVLSTVSGGLCDEHGVKFLYMFSGLGSSIGLSALSFCPPGAVWEILLTQGLLLGVTFSFGIQPACTVVAHHFDKKRASTMGLVFSGCSMGAVCYSFMFTQLQPKIGFAWTMRIAAIKVLIMYSIALKISKAIPNGGKIKFDTLFDFRGLYDARYAVLVIGGFLVNLGLWVPGFHITTYARKVYPACSITPYLLPLMSSSGIPGAIVGGIIGDHFGRLNVMIPMTFLSGLTCLFVWRLAPSVSILALFASSFGFTSGAVVSLLAPTVSQILPANKVGARMGAFYSIISIATLTGAPIGGAILNTTPEKSNDYHGLIVYSASALLIGSLVLAVARLVHGRDQGRQW